jgi:hypothetical protein
MGPDALFREMMWYAIHILRYTHRSEWEKLFAAETASTQTQLIANH